MVGTAAFYGCYLLIVGLAARGRITLGDMTLYSITGYESVDAYSRGDIDGGSVYAFPTGAPGVALFPAESADGLPNHRQHSQEFRVESNEWGRFDWQAGLFWFDEKIDVDSFSYDGFGGPENGYARQHQDNTAWAVFASGDFDVTDSFLRAPLCQGWRGDTPALELVLKGAGVKVQTGAGVAAAEHVYAAG